MSDIKIPSGEDPMEALFSEPDRAKNLLFMVADQLAAMKDDELTDIPRALKEYKRGRRKKPCKVLYYTLLPVPIIAGWMDTERLWRICQSSSVPLSPPLSLRW